VVGLVLAGLIFGIVQLSGGSLFSSAPSTETPAETPTLTLTPTEPDSTATTRPTSTVTPTATETEVPPPELGVGSLLVNQADQASMAYIPAGEFQMGSASGGRDEQPVSTVNLDAFWIYQTEVINQQYGQCVAAGKCALPGGSFYGVAAYDNHPVVNVDFDQARSYCQWAGGRLPTEAEWEKAARGGQQEVEYPWGNTQPVCDLGAKNGAQFSACLPFSSVPVGSFGSNDYSLFDMAGNAWEWTNSCYQDYPYNPADGRENVTQSCRPVLRGGSRGSSASNLRLALRNPIPLQQSDDLTGFRCVVDPD
jgi:formylglycine-generating enzyme required for sulfatase activity